ncbi:hypothetical protein [uncultured Clostridium sp.]|uniref:hypothetical protein n=1 Tax=uncultured Clostridium sp. TaxID=59620 RepID=UPI00260E5E1F|nr:hypothetical protein [uncultured Clostridium sp.]
MNKKIIDTLKNKDIYGFRLEIDKIGKEILEKIQDNKYDNKDVFNIYFETLKDLWSLENNKINSLADLEKYLDTKVKNRKNIEDYRLFDNRKSFLSLNDKSISKKARLNRYLLYLNELIVEEILLDDFKNTIGEKKIEFERVISCRKRVVTPKGIAYNNELNEVYIKLYLISKNFIYEKPLNIKYINIYKDKPYKIYSMNEIEAMKNKGNKEMIILFTDGDILSFKENNKIEEKEIKEYFFKKTK